MLELYIMVGVVVSFFYYEIIGILPGGIIVPGYLALYIVDQPFRVLATIISAFFSFILVKYVISRYMIIYGSRRFFLMILVNYVVGTFILSASGLILPIEIKLTPVGFLIGGIIANNYSRQGIIVTLINMLGAVMIIHLIAITFNFI